ncbi:hypothetical protein BN1263100020 [Stenotrophomonas thermophila]|nr:hypothetical protein BN1263100020 [Stenotrophomonas maltophilia]
MFLISGKPLFLGLPVTAANKQQRQNNGIRKNFHCFTFTVSILRILDPNSGSAN